MALRILRQDQTCGGVLRRERRPRVPPPKVRGTHCHLRQVESALDRVVRANGCNLQTFKGTARSDWENAGRETVGGHALGSDVTKSAQRRTPLLENGDLRSSMGAHFCPILGEVGSPVRNQKLPVGSIVPHELQRSLSAKSEKDERQQREDCDGDQQAQECWKRALLKLHRRVAVVANDGRLVRRVS